MVMGHIRGRAPLQCSLALGCRSESRLHATVARSTQANSPTQLHAFLHRSSTLSVLLCTSMYFHIPLWCQSFSFLEMNIVVVSA